MRNNPIIHRPISYAYLVVCERSSMAVQLRENIYVFVLTMKANNEISTAIKLAEEDKLGLKPVS